MNAGAKKQVDQLSSGLAEVISAEELERKISKSLRERKPLRVKYGADPSAPDLHLGHSIPLLKLRQFQDFGHTVLFLIGDFTAMIGDPSGRSDTRPALSADQVRENARTYTEQCFKILRRENVEIVYNSSWCSKLFFADVLRLAARHTVARLLERDDFAERYRQQRAIHMHEMLYPLVQAYDSVVLRADVELCGTDQKFNCLLAREMQERDGQEPEVIAITPLLVGLDGQRKMSKSLGNYVGLTSSPAEMFGRLMSIPDVLMYEYYRLLLARSEGELTKMKQDVAAGRRHPMRLKSELAAGIAAQYHPPAEVEQAGREFSRVFSQGEQPQQMAGVNISRAEKAQGINLSVLMVRAGLAASRSRAKQLIAAGAVSLDGVKIADHDPVLKPEAGAVLKVGKRGFARLTYQSSDGQA